METFKVTLSQGRSGTVPGQNAIMISSFQHQLLMINSLVIARSDLASAFAASVLLPGSRAVPRHKRSSSALSEICVEAIHFTSV
jgi:hypothetical protein